MDVIYRDEHNDYRVTEYMGNDPAKRKLYHVARIDGHYNSHTATPTRMNPWTTKEEATKNLHTLATSWSACITSWTAAACSRPSRKISRS